MTIDNLTYPSGATLIDGDELAALIPDIHLQSELNEYERNNIRAAMRWSRSSRKLKAELLSIGGLRLLHQRMFDEVWRWAGTFRTTGKNIGVFPQHISESLLNLCEDTRFQIAEDNIAEDNVDWPEIAVRFHHRLVSIHPFPNGNGRHARLATNLLLQYNGQNRLRWGEGDLESENEIRQEYLRCLRLADRGDLAPLRIFAK